MIAREPKEMAGMAEAKARLKTEFDVSLLINYPLLVNFKYQSSTIAILVMSW
jgi:hypothetical protein